jgi:hypothetical protein
LNTKPIPLPRVVAADQGSAEGGLTMTVMAAESGLTVAPVSQLVSRAEQEMDGGGKT